MDRFDFPDDTDVVTLARLRGNVPPPTDDALTAARLRLTAAMDGPALASSQSANRARYARRAAAGVAAAVAVGLGAFALTGQDPAPGSQAGPSTPAVAPPTGQQTPAHRVANVAQLLDAAAVAALQPVPAGRYLHTSSHSLSVSSVDDPPGHGAYTFVESRTEQWEPAEAADPGYERDVGNISVTEPSAKQRRYVENAPVDLTERTDTWYRTDADGQETQVYPAGGSDPACVGGCTVPAAWDGPTRRSVASLPTDPHALRASLFRWATAMHDEATKYHKPTTIGSIALGAIGNVVDSGYASPELRSALFRIAATVPGVTLTGAMANYDGVRGVAVSSTDPFDVQLNLIFAADGSAYLGERAVVVHPSAQYQLEAGTVVSWTAVRTDVTDRPTLPKGARD